MTYDAPDRLDTLGACPSAQKTGAIARSTSLLESRRHQANFTHGKPPEFKARSVSLWVSAFVELADLVDLSLAPLWGGLGQFLTGALRRPAAHVCFEEVRVLVAWRLLDKVRLSAGRLVGKRAFRRVVHTGGWGVIRLFPRRPGMAFGRMSASISVAAARGARTGAQIPSESCGTLQSRCHTSLVVLAV